MTKQYNETISFSRLILPLKEIDHYYRWEKGSNRREREKVG
jgi:hypothetical protein